MNPDSIPNLLQSIQQRSGLHRQGGKPLYAYRTTPDELEALRLALHRQIQLDGRLRTPQEHGAFCLYGAEFFCQNHVSGPWKWAEILDPIEYHPPLASLYRVVRRGLQYWNREVVRIALTSQYLITLACEGGLPLKLLERHETHLARYFRRLLVVRERFAQTSTSELAKRYALLLPLTLQNENVHALAVALIEAVVDLRRLAGDAPDPVSKLDQHDPSWRDRIPLRISADVAWRLIGGLLRERHDISTGLPPIRIHAYLEPDESGQWVCRRYVEIPESTVAESDLTHVLAHTGDGLPSRFQLALSVNQETPRVFAVATRLYARDEYQFDLTPLALGTADAAQLHLLAGDRLPEQSPIYGGDPLPELPWVFRYGDGLCPLLSTGSIRIPDELVWVAVPEEWDVLAEPDAILEAVADLPSTRRRLVRLRGKACFSGPDERIAVETRSAEDTSHHYGLHGKMTALGPGGTPVWLGMPHVRALGSAENAEKQIPANQVEWRPLHAPRRAWGRAHTLSCGDGTLRVREGEETFFRVEATVFPQEFAWRIRPGEAQAEGVIELTGIPVDDVGLEDFRAPLDLTWQPHENDEGVRISLRTLDGSQPPFVHLRLHHVDGNESHLRIPFPAQQIAFLGPDWSLLRSGTSVSIDQIDGIRARVITPDPRPRYLLKACIPGCDYVLGFLLSHADNPSTKELPLDQVRLQLRALLYQSSELDAGLTLRIERESFALPRALRAELQIRRYPARVDRQELATTPGVSYLTVADEELPSPILRHTAKLQLFAEPLWDPKKEPEPLPQSPDRAWLFDHAAHQPGAWLITGRAGLAEWTRPTLITVGAPDPSTWASELDRIIHAPDPDALMPDFISRLASDPSHEDWEHVLDFLASLEHRSAATYKIVKHLSRSSPAMALAAFMAATRSWFEDFWREMESLPFLWHLIPLDTWGEAAAFFLESLRSSCSLNEDTGSRLPPAWESILEATLRPFIQKAPLQQCFMSCVAEYLHIRCPEIPAPAECHHTLFSSQAGRQVYDRLIADAQQELLRFHADDPHWPQFSCDVEDLAMECGLELSPLTENKLRIHAPNAYQRDAMNAPIMAAAMTVYGCSGKASSAVELRLLRAFEPSWFDRAHALTTAYLMAIRLRAGSPNSTKQ